MAHKSHHDQDRKLGALERLKRRLPQYKDKTKKSDKNPDHKVKVMEQEIKVLEERTNGQLI